MYADNMNIVVEPEYYSPSIDKDGNYIDRPLNNNEIRHGVKCHCGSRKNMIYNIGNFTTHTKTKRHVQWLSEMNNNKRNYYAENIKLSELVDSQKIIIARLDLEKRTLLRDVITKSNTIDVLSEIIKKYKTKYVNDDYDIDENVSMDIDRDIDRDIDKLFDQINV